MRCIVGSVTEYSPYYPPRIGLSVDWYAANPGFHPIPAGYGLPWGTPEEEFIPVALVQEAEFALAREQLKTQTPEIRRRICRCNRANRGSRRAASASMSADQPEALPHRERRQSTCREPASVAACQRDWPDPRGFVPPPPSAVKPPLRPQAEPIMSHTRVYHGQDGEFTRRLATYYYFRDDARFGGWQHICNVPRISSVFVAICT